jgi:type VI secretion system protein ImpM
MNDNARTQPGIFGKLPTHGDFITRRLPLGFVEHWDLWLQNAVSDSRDQLGENWLDIYLTSPVWRFALSPGTVDQSAWAGVLMPSVDRVGRYFPLTLAVALQPNDKAIRVLSEEKDWFDSAEALLRTCLEDDFDLASFDRSLINLVMPWAVAPEDDGPEPQSPANSPDFNAWRFEMPGNANPDAAYPRLLDRALGDLFLAYSLWWTEGSERISPSVLICQGLPPVHGFCSMLAGDWQARGWRES